LLASLLHGGSEPARAFNRFWAFLFHWPRLNEPELQLSVLLLGAACCNVTHTRPCQLQRGSLSSGPRCSFFGSVYAELAINLASWFGVFKMLVYIVVHMYIEGKKKKKKKNGPLCGRRGRSVGVDLGRTMSRVSLAGRGLWWPLISPQAGRPELENRNKRPC
jgi:hypothetical protein